MVQSHSSLMAILFLVMDQEVFPRNPSDCIILDIWVFYNLISVDDLSAKALRRFESCLLVNNNSKGKLVSSSPIISDDNLETTSVSFFIADFNLVSCDLIALHLNSCIVSFYTDKS